MKQLSLDPSWPESWKMSHTYDLLELWGDRGAPGYTSMYRCRRKDALELIRKAAEPPARVLDVAAAQGNFSLTLAEMGYDVTWNDLRADLIDYVKLKHERGQIQFLPGNVFELKPEEPYDIVLLMEVIEHVAHPDQLLGHVAALLKPGGHLVMTTPLGSYFINKLPRFSDCPDPSQYEAMQFKPNLDGHIFLLHLDEIRTLAGRAGLEVAETVLGSNPLTSGHVKLAAALKVLPKGFVFACERIGRRLPRRFAAKLHSSVAVLLRKP